MEEVKEHRSPSLFWPIFSTMHELGIAFFSIHLFLAFYFLPDSPGVPPSATAHELFRGFSYVAPPLLVSADREAAAAAAAAAAAGLPVDSTKTTSAADALEDQDSVATVVEIKLDNGGGGDGGGGGNGNNANGSKPKKRLITPAILSVRKGACCVLALYSLADASVIMRQRREDWRRCIFRIPPWRIS